MLNFTNYIDRLKKERKIEILPFLISGWVINGVNCGTLRLKR